MARAWKVRTCTRSRSVMTRRHGNVASSTSGRRVLTRTFRTTAASAMGLRILPRMPFGSPRGALLRLHCKIPASRPTKRAGGCVQ